MSSSASAPKGYTFCYYVSGHGFGHATRVNQIITELLKSTSSSSNTATNSTGTTATLAPATAISTENTKAASSTTTSIAPYVPSESRHTIYIVSDAPEFIFGDVTALGAIYRNAKVDAGVVQPLAYSVDRQKTIEGVKNFLARREETLQTEVSWLAQVGADCVLADAPFLPCAAASAYGIPACLITNFTFDEVYRFLQEGDDLDKDVMAVADAALEDYKKASLLLRLPGSIDIPSFEDEILTMESSRSNGSPSISDMDDTEEDHRILSLSSLQEQEHEPQLQRQHQQLQAQDKLKDAVGGPTAVVLPMDVDEHYRRSSSTHQSSNDTIMGDATPAGIMSPAASIGTTVSSPSPSIIGRFRSSSIAAGDSTLSMASASPMLSKVQSLTRKVIDVPLVVRMAVNTREDVLRSLGVDEVTIATKKMVLVSFGGQRLKQGWGNPLPEGWIGVICGLPVEHELPEGFYRSPHGVYVPDLTRAADIVIGKLGYGTCSECIAHDTPLIYVSRPQFIEEQGLIKLMINHGLPVEMTAEEFENGHWQRSILEADRLAQEEKEGRRLHMESCSEDSHDEHQEAEEEDSTTSDSNNNSSSSKKSGVPLAESTNKEKLAKDEPVSLGRRTRRSSSVSSLSAFRIKGSKMARLSPVDDDEQSSFGHEEVSESLLPIEAELEKTYVPAIWFERRIPNNGGEVCARLVEEFMAQLEEDDE